MQAEERNERKVVRKKVVSRNRRVFPNHDTDWPGIRWTNNLLSSCDIDLKRTLQAEGWKENESRVYRTSAEFACVSHCTNC
jgi:hypothetical protein